MDNHRLWKNKAQRLISKSKVQIYSSSINENKQNKKKLWKHLHDLTNKPKPQSTPLVDNREGEPILDPEETANSFNGLFTTIFQTYSKDGTDTCSVSEKLNSFVHSKLSPEVKFVIPPVSLTFVQNKLEPLDPSKATRLDGLSAKFLRISAPIIAAPVTKILNLSSTTGIFQTASRKLKSLLVLERGIDLTCPTIDQCLSSPPPPPLLSKVIEKHVAENHKSYMSEHDLLYERQSEFRSNHSCETALTAMVDEWLSAIDNNEIVGTALLDLS